MLKELILNGLPINMVGFWGVGSKKQPDQNDIRLFRVYEHIAEAIGGFYVIEKPVAMTIILADIHGLFNGFTGYEDYLGAIAGEAKSRGISTVSLKDLYIEWDIQLPESKPADRELDEWKRFESSRRFSQLVKSAEKHSHVGLPAEDAAFRYWQMRQQEREPLANSFQGAALVVNGSEDLGRETLPLKMPHMYLKEEPVWFQEGG